MKKRRKTIGYLWVCSDDSDLDKSKSDISQLVNEKKLGNIEWVEEKVSGKIRWSRRQMARIIDELCAGDNLIVFDLASVGLSMVEIMEMLAVILSKKINFYTAKGNWQFDESIQSMPISMGFSLAAKIERDIISRRTKQALMVKKKQGVKLGRPKGTGKSRLDPFRSEIETLLNNGSTQRFIARRYNVAETTLSRWLKKHSLKRPVF